MTLPLSTSDLRQRADRITPGGVHSNVRLAAPRVFFAGGRGARLFDVEGKDYVDYLLGQGPAFLGHGHPAVTEAVARATATGMVFGAQHPLEVEAGELLLEALQWPDKVRFGVSGTEAVQGALRIARAATGRTKIVRFSGHYHGWLDNVLMGFTPDGPVTMSDGQDDSALQDWLVTPFNDIEALTALVSDRGQDIAAIILEPVMCNQGAIPATIEFLEAARRLASEAGIVLIFDEVITGFRVALGGAAEYFGVSPDLAIYGKALAGGWPVSAIAGIDALMAPIGTGAVNHSGTFNGSTMAAAAIAETMRVLRDDPPYERIERHGGELMSGIRSLASTHGLPLSVEGLPVAFHAAFDTVGPYRSLEDLAGRDTDRYTRFANLLAEHGVWVAGRGIWYVSAAHGQQELDDALSRIDTAMAAEAQ